MATRKIKDAKDLSTNELIYFKGHAQATYMSDGTTVEDAINNISVSGGGNGEENVQSDWNVTDSTSDAFIKNKPTIPTESTVSGWGFTKNAGTVTSVKSNGTTLTVSSGVVNIPSASTATYGVTKLSTSTSSASTVEAATPSAVKAAYDLANSYKGTVTGVTIDGVSKSPSSGVVDLGYIHKQLSTTTSSSMVIKPNMYYRNTSTSLTSLTITLYKTDVNGILNEYFVEFTTRNSGTTVSFPSTIKWVNGTAPTFEAGCTYQVSIVNNLGTYIKFA